MGGAYKGFGMIAWENVASSEFALVPQPYHQLV